MTEQIETILSLGWDRLPLRQTPLSMVGHQHPCITPAASQRKILFKSTKKIIPVAVVKKDILAI